MNVFVTGGRVAQAAVRAAGVAVEGARPDLQDLRLPPPQQALPRPGGRGDQAGARGENRYQIMQEEIMSNIYILSAGNVVLALTQFAFLNEMFEGHFIF